ncbi:pseudaminic acid biosynthesis-associated methylase [Hoeflea sp. TYP-13]|uniref:pseudaminic acid biosynthesis-associated methylase n=1 Tax=Hoeflea sp. TYP-13 TaxID=3230023 RepID=UPI0034C65B87
MAKKFKTDQEMFWAGDFGDNYIGRNNSDQLLNSKIALWGKMLRSANNIASIMEFGCNAGLNLEALKRLSPKLELCGIEINDQAASEAEKIGGVEVLRGSILEEIDTDKVFDLTFTAGVLIHINPEHLNIVYNNLYNKSDRYVLVAEYYNPSPVSISYRGHSDRLFKRDFAGEIMEAFNMRLVDYGFVYKRDNWAPQDDITWFLLEK